MYQNTIICHKFSQDCAVPSPCPGFSPNTINSAPAFGHCWVMGALWPLAWWPGAGQAALQAELSCMWPMAHGLDLPVVFSWSSMPERRELNIFSSSLPKVEGFLNFIFCALWIGEATYHDLDLRSDQNSYTSFSEAWWWFRTLPVSFVLSLFSNMNF